MEDAGVFSAVLAGVLLVVGFLWVFSSGSEPAPEQLPEHLLFLDFETTGLDPEKDVILEVGAIAVTRSMVEIGSYGRVLAMSLVPEPAPDCRQDMVQALRTAARPRVQKMHDRNGLWRDLEAATTSINRAEDYLCEMLDSLHAIDGKKVQLAGFSVHFDHAFAAMHMPRLAKHPALSHRRMDLSVPRALFRAWAPDAEVLPAEVAHRALPDCRAAFDALKVVRRELRRL